MATCQKCGALWADDSTTVSYYFSSASKPQGSYTSPSEIIGLGEAILTCPLDVPLVSKPEAARWGSGTPSGGSMMEGDDRQTVGEETHPSKDEV